MTHNDRSAQWREIWTKKGLDSSAPLHHLNGADLLTAEQWEDLVRIVTAPMGITSGQSILECGCGAGAFLSTLTAMHPGIRVAGIDYSPTLIAAARKNVDGLFHEGDMSDLGVFSTAMFDHSASYSTFHYLSSPEVAGRVVREMLRVTRPGGTVFIGEVSDEAKRAVAAEARKSSHAGVRHVAAVSPDHLFLPKSFFEEIARATESGIRIIDHTEYPLGHYTVSAYRYSVYLTRRKS